MAKTKSPKLSSVQIAAKQRHLLLLGKVKDNKPLSRAELGELKRYERKAKLDKPVDSKRDKITEVLAARKKGTAKRGRMPLSEAEVRRLSLECDTVADADSEIKTRSPLVLILKRYPKLKLAWDRGRFQRSLKAAAGQSQSF